jgi:hypothetical protein
MEKKMGSDIITIQIIGEYLNKLNLIGIIGFAAALVIATIIWNKIAGD